MSNILKVILIISLVSFIGCKTDKKKVKSMDPNKVERTTPSKEAKKFFTKNEIALPSNNDTYFSKENEVILFRPSEFEFGRLLEETQSEKLLNQDGDFEELTNAIIDTYRGNKNIKISICEKPFIGIPIENDTLYFDTSKDLHGVIFCKKNELPVLKPSNEQDVIQLIKKTYNL